MGRRRYYQEFQSIEDIQKEFKYFVPIIRWIDSLSISQTPFNDDFIILNRIDFSEIIEKNDRGGYFKNERDAMLFKLMIE